MNKELIKDYKGLVKVNHSYIVNEDDAAYKQALERRSKNEKEQKLNDRVDKLETMLEEVLNLLKGKS